jgi:hypothetical protein
MKNHHLKFSLFFGLLILFASLTQAYHHPVDDEDDIDDDGDTAGNIIGWTAFGLIALLLLLALFVFMRSHMKEDSLFLINARMREVSVAKQHNEFF